MRPLKRDALYGFRHFFVHAQNGVSRRDRRGALTGRAGSRRHARRPHREFWAESPEHHALHPRIARRVR